ncbi:MAG: glycosyltransferase, partial [Verrucomicrobiales bacterium]|nr:glycosyltransferase [Verrucomicrobiales bacterium]
MHATVIIPTFKRPDRLRRTLLGLNRQRTIFSFEVIVIEDGPQEAFTQTCAAKLDVCYPIQWLADPSDSRRPRGAAWARNHGIRAARGDVLLFLDDDMIVAEGFIDAHMAVHRAQPRCGVIGLRRRVPSARWVCIPEEDLVALAAASQPDPRLNALVSGALTETPWAYFATCNASVGRDEVLAVGLFDEAFRS